ncbi:hypothetical protein [Streptomyces sp. NPDC051214]|uniref:hypothetical protein n=1 Tax=Streptomyces sp. NPDC051214 TaxID=3155282 RepID=UPI00341EA15A
MGLLIIAMDRIEDTLNEEAGPRTDRRVRHLRLVHGQGHAGRRHARRHRAPTAERRGDAA